MSKATECANDGLPLLRNKREIPVKRNKKAEFSGMINAEFSIAIPLLKCNKMLIRAINIIVNDVSLAILVYRNECVVFSGIINKADSIIKIRYGRG